VNSIRSQRFKIKVSTDQKDELIKVLRSENKKKDEQILVLMERVKELEA